jgi:IS5 family transposase
MIIDRYEPVELFALVPKLSKDFEPELQELDKLLDDDIIFARVKADLSGRSRHSVTRGRHSTPVEVILRMLVVKKLYGWSYEQAEHFVADSLVLRQFCRVYLETVPDDTTLMRWARLIGPATVEALNERVVELARTLKVTRGRKLRVDSTVVETNIHYPTDSGLLNDGVRVVSRLLRRAKGILGETDGLGKEAFRSRGKSAQRLAQQLHRLVRAKSEAAKRELKEAYSALLTVTEASCKQAERVYEAAKASLDDKAQRLATKLEQTLPLVQQIISQMLCGESVPAKEKLVSLFEPHTQIISHRFSTVRLADKIVVLENGTVAQRGSHDALLEQGGTYAQMYRLQARGYAETTR